jgi:uncharacterized protein (DUF486 family)
MRKSHSFGEACLHDPGEKFKWNYAAGFTCMVLGVFFVFHKW